MTSGRSMGCPLQQLPAGLHRQVFISHTGQDEQGVTFAASILRPAFTKAGLDVFIDYKSLQLGCDWQAKLVEAAATSAVFVVVLSRSFGRRFWCLRELDLALHGHPEYPRGNAKPCIIPVFIDPPSSINKLSKEEVEQQLQEHMAALARGQDPLSEGQALQELLQDPERLINNLAALKDYQGVRRQRQTQQQQQQQGQEQQLQLQETLHLERQPAPVVQQQQALTSNTAASSSKPVPVPKDEEYQLAVKVVTAVLQQLPVQAYVAPGLVGYKEQLADLTAQLAVDDPHVLGLWLHGTGGMGKTTMATLLYNTLSSSFTHAAMVELDLEGSTPEQLRNHLKTVCESLGLPTGGAGPQLLQRVADFMQRNKVLLLLDNVNHSTQLDGLLPTTLSSGSRVIITSREAELQSSTAYKVLIRKRRAGQSGPPIRSYGLKPLQDEASKELFRACHGLSEAELEDMGLCDIERQLLKACSGLPLALQVVGGALNPDDDDDDEPENIKRLWQEVGQFAHGRWKSTGHSDETKLLQDVVYYSFSRLLSEAAQNMFLDCVSVLHQQSYHRAMMVWEAWWPHEAHRAFRRLEQLSLVNTTLMEVYCSYGPDKADAQRLVVLDVIRSLGQSIILNQPQPAMAAAADVGRHYGSRIWLGSDFQPVGIMVGAKPVGINLPLRGLPQSALQGCDLSELRILMTTDAPPDVWHQAPHLLCVCHLWPMDADAEDHTEVPPAPNESTCRHTAPANMQASTSSPLQELVLLELWHMQYGPDTFPLSAGWQELVQVLCNTDAPPALRRMVLDAQLLEQCCSEVELRAFTGTISGCSGLQHLYLYRAEAQAWALVFDGHPAVECIQLVSCKLAAFPKSFGGLSALQELHLRLSGEIVSSCEQFGALPCLRSVFTVAGAGLTLSESFLDLSSLQVLEVDTGRRLCLLPEQFGRLTALQALDLAGYKGISLPNSFVSLTNLKVLLLRWSHLSTLPEAFGDLTALQVLHLSGGAAGGQLKSLPDSFGELRSLQVLDLSHQPLCSLPESFGNLSALRVVDLTSCKKLTALPESFDQLTALQVLDMEDCVSINRLPSSFGGLVALEELYINGCVGLSLPGAEVLLQLPALKRLDVRGCEGLVDLQEFSGPEDSSVDNRDAWMRGPLWNRCYISDQLYCIDVGDILKQCNDGLFD